MDPKEGETWQIRRVGPAATCRNVLNIMKLKIGINTFGRSPNNDFFLDSKILKNFISRHHAVIIGETREGGSDVFFLQEKGLNGTFINDVRIKGSSILTEGDKITFGHTNGYKIEPGQYSRQPHSEFQFVFEKFQKRNELTKQQGLDSVEYHQTRTCCGTRKLPSSPEYDRSECCDTVDKQGALRTSRSPTIQEHTLPASPQMPVICREENDLERGRLKNISSVCPNQNLCHVQKSPPTPEVPHFVEEVEVQGAANSIESHAECFVGNCGNVCEVDQSNQCKSPVLTNGNSGEASSQDDNLDSPKDFVTDIQEELDTFQKKSNFSDDCELNKSENENGFEVPVSKTDVSPCKQGVTSFEPCETKGPTNPKRMCNSRPNSAKSSSSYDECDGDVKGGRNIWSIMSDSNDETMKDSSAPSPVGESSFDQSDDPVTHQQDESFDNPTNNHTLGFGQPYFTDGVQNSHFRKDHDGETNSMFSEDSDSKSSDTRTSNQSGSNPNKRRKARRFAPRTKRTRMRMKNDEKLEEGVEWYEEETCAAQDCSKPTDRRVQWVQCDDCDKWFHTVCAGCRYDDIKDSTKQFHCGCG
ncbi:uncharacterized protein LOC124280324 [Haliotis rubra]|uniref:uncharacterized protein LOC124280324 n=1 Tax=Haliotis rubra TaxID=36100 RepID=UPI001EE568E6|nr:uncharacterized protein LOC124280324 [Haliotis rubra]